MGSGGLPKIGLGQIREGDLLRRPPRGGQDDVGGRALAADLEEKRDLAGVVDGAVADRDVLHGELEHGVAGSQHLAAQRVVAGEEPDLRRPLGRSGDEHRLGAIAQAVARGQAPEDRVLAAREQDVDHASASREERRTAAVAEHEAVVVDGGRVARPGARVDRALVGQRAAGPRVDVHVARRGALGREGDHAGVVDGGRAEVDEIR